MARLFKARLRDGADAGAVQGRTGILLWPGAWKPLNEYNIGSARVEALCVDPDVEIEWETCGGQPAGGQVPMDGPLKAEPEAVKPGEGRRAKE
jgi:hypothetical protein